VEIAEGDPAACDTGLPGAVGGGKGFDGRSFLGVLLGQKTEHDRLAFGAFSDRIRSARDAHYLYVVNRDPGRPQESIASALKLGIWPIWVREAKTNAAAARLIKRTQSPPAEELYDVQADPHQLNNLAVDPKYREPLEALQRELVAWRKQYGDVP
jgi:N-sulfoglucosamine sulfohydrolase